MNHKNMKVKGCQISLGSFAHIFAKFSQPGNCKVTFLVFNSSAASYQLLFV